MATVQRNDSRLHVRFTVGEKIAGLVRNVDVPLSAVTGADVVSDPLTVTRGLRSPGMALPGLRKIGTWRRPGEKTLLCVRHGQPAVRIHLTGQRYDTLLIGTDDATALAAELTAAR
jgi:hypothetical protein